MTDAFRAGDEVADMTFDPAPVGVVTGTDGGTGWPLVAWADTRSLVEVVDPARLLRTRPPGERGEPSDPALMAASPEAVMDGTEPRPRVTDEQLAKLTDDAAYWGPQVYTRPGLAADLAADLRASRAREAAWQQRWDFQHRVAQGWLANWKAAQQRIDKALAIYGNAGSIDNWVAEMVAALSGDAS